MIRQVEAIYENGVLRPLEPLPLEEHQHVKVVISEDGAAPDRSLPDADYIAAVRREVAAIGCIPTLDEIHRITGKDSDSWAEAVRGEREERF